MQQIAKETRLPAPAGPLHRLGAPSSWQNSEGVCATRPHVVVVRGADELIDHVPALEELAGEAAEPNVFYEPWMLLPAIRSFGRDTEFLFILIYSTSHPHPGPLGTAVASPLPPDGSSGLIAFFPLERASRYRKAPVSVLRLWRHQQCGYCTPLVRKGLATRAVTALFDWLYSGDSGSHLIEFGLIDWEGDFALALRQHLAANSIRHYQADCFGRALFAPASDAEAYLKQASGKRHRKDIARRESRLAAAGQMEYVSLSDPAEIQSWIESFLELESSGWKGRNGTALACISGGRRFLTSILLEAFGRNRLMMIGIRLDGKLIAAKCNLVAGTGSFAFKIAYDERYAEFSPGLLLEVENIRRLHRMPAIQWMDSCAAPRHPMIDHLWPGRRAIETILAPGGKAFGSIIVAALPLLKQIKRRFRDTSMAIATPITRGLALHRTARQAGQNTGWRLLASSRGRVAIPGQPESGDINDKAAFPDSRSAAV